MRSQGESRILYALDRELRRRRHQRIWRRVVAVVAFVAWWAALLFIANRAWS
jgi:hypothetical protein